MKVRDILTQETWDIWGDMDVANDVTDDLAPCWCGELLTEEGEKKFAKALELEAEIRPVWGTPGIVLKIDQYPDWEKKWNRAQRMFTAMAGYCTEEEWNKWFKSI